MKGQLAIPWRRVGLLQTLICWELLSRETTVAILERNMPRQVGFDDDICLNIGGYRHLPITKDDTIEWAKGIWAGLTVLLPNQEMYFFHDMGWVDTDENGDSVTLEIPSLIRMKSFMSTVMVHSRDPLFYTHTLVHEANFEFVF